MEAIFILVNGKWQMHGEAMQAGSNAAYVASELAYLRNSLGLTAKLFRRVA